MLTAYMVLIDDKAMRSEFEAFYYDNRLRGMRVAYNILHSEALAEEALSEAFFNAAKCFQKIHDLPSHKQQAFFVITVRNTALNMMKKERPDITVDYNDELDHNALPDADKGTLKECLSKLNDTDRDILYLRYELGYSHDEIAAALGISEDASRQRVRYAKSKLRKLLDEE